MAGLQQVMDVEVLSRLWSADFDPSNPSGVSVFLSSLPAREEAFYTELLIKKTSGTGVRDAKRSLVRLEIKDIESRMELTKGKLRTPGLSEQAISQTINSIMLLKKELVEKQKELHNIE